MYVEIVHVQIVNQLAKYIGIVGDTNDNFHGEKNIG